MSKNQKPGRMKVEPLEHILRNPRPGIRYAVIHHYKGNQTLTVRMKSMPAKMLRTVHGPYKQPGHAKAAFSRMYQPGKYWQKPQWKQLEANDE